MKEILIVDDQPYMMQLYTTELTDKNYTIISAEDIEKALEYLDSLKIDLVILDLYINGFNGWNLLESIKQKYPDLPVLIITAYDNLMNDPRAKQADGYLLKNLKNVDLIFQKVEELLH